MDKQAAATLKGDMMKQWRERLARYDAGGISIVDFCKRESVTEGAFYRRRAQLRRQATAPASFIDLGAAPCAAVRSAVPHAAVESVAQVEIRLDLGNGVMLHIVRH